MIFRRVKKEMGARTVGMRLNKEEFLKTELGSGMVQCAIAWDKALDGFVKHRHSGEEYRREREAATWCQAQWEVYQMAVKQFYGIEYHFSRTDELVGIVTEDESDWLFRMEKGDAR